jgi:hypothetical protein
MKSLFGRLRAPLVVVAVFVALTLLMTWPQARVLGSEAFPHQDVYFNMWRLDWIAHAFTSRSAHIFDGNIFYPEPRTLALSDAMLVEGSVAAPLIIAGMPPVLVHNLMLLGAIALSGAAMFALVFYLTRSRGAALLAGIVFAFVPYRFEHYMHMELQWTMWMPLAFLAFHKTLETGSMRAGIATGLLVALQMLSSIYYGVFLATLLGIAGIFFLFFDRRGPLRRALVPLAAGAVLAGAISAAYAIPYMQMRQQVGERSRDQVVTFSARPSSYLVATPTNWLYGDLLQARGRGERRLFPGILIVILAIIGLLLKPPPVRAIVYLLALIVAFELSLGFRGYTYGFLFEFVPVYRGLRAAARLGIFVAMFLGILGAFGYVAMVQSMSAATRRVLLGVLVAVLLIEYRAPVPLTPFVNKAPAIYRFLAALPRGVVAEFPTPRPEALPGFDAQYAYMSIFHRHPLVNGYSGVYPPSYLARMDRLRHFPDATSLRQLRRDGVRYVIVHEALYPADKGPEIVRDVGMLGDFRDAGTFDDGSGSAHVFVMR